MPEMDGLRAVSVFLVLHHHWFQPNLPLVGWGVSLFFVISGFLITEGIYDLRAKNIALARAARIFFIKRTVRLVPLYLLLIVIGYIFFDGVRENIFYFLTYTSNFLPWMAGNWAGVPFPPTWSLAVEEQFYLFWFFLAFLLKKDKLVFLCLILYVVSFLFRYAAVPGSPKTMLWMNFDALAAGAFVFLLREKINPERLSRWYVVLVLALSITLYYALVDPIKQLWHSVFVLGGAILVLQSAGAHRDIFGHVLSMSAISYLGKISYGIYIYHMMTPTLTNYAASTLPFVWRVVGPDTVSGFISHCVLTVGLAALSYKFFENPIRTRFAPKV